MPSSRHGVLAVLLAGVLLGTAGTAQALGPSETTPIAVGAFRVIVGALTLIVVMVATGQSLVRLPALWRTSACVVCAVGAGAYQPLFFAAVERSGVAFGTLVTVGSAPLFAAVIGRIVDRHRPTVAWLVATALCVIGLALRTGGRLESGDLPGLLFALSAGLCIGLWNGGAKRLLQAGATYVEVGAATFSLAGLVLLPGLLAQPLGWVATPGGIGLVLYLGVLTMAVANLLLSRGIHALPIGPVATLTLSDPLVATVLGVVVLGEAIAPIAVVGIVLVFVGLALQGSAIAREPELEREALPTI